MCHFHQAKTVRRYITKRPRLQAGKDLKKIMYRLKETNEKNFTKKLDEWYEEYKDFIEEKSTNIETGKSYYTHYKVRAAHRSLRSNLPYLFTRKKYKDIEIPNTTNTLDGGTFSPLKILIKIHRGLSKSLKLKLVDDYLLNYKKKWLFSLKYFTLNHIRVVFHTFTLSYFKYCSTSSICIVFKKTLNFINEMFVVYISIGEINT